MTDPGALKSREFETGASSVLRRTFSVGGCWGGVDAKQIFCAFDMTLQPPQGGVLLQIPGLAFAFILIMILVHCRPDIALLRGGGC